MDLWFSELHTPYVKFSIQIDKQLHSEQTEFQRIDIFESKEFGRMMVLDGYVMLTEKDEFIYHEMIVHVWQYILIQREYSSLAVAMVVQLVNYCVIKM